jgi:hypothetical protein
MSHAHRPSKNGHARTVDVTVLWAQVLPVRCDWQQPDGIITTCDDVQHYSEAACKIWSLNPPDSSEVDLKSYLADALDIRRGSITAYSRSGYRPADFYSSVSSNQEFQVKVLVNETSTIANA